MTPPRMRRTDHGIGVPAVFPKIIATSTGTAIHAAASQDENSCSSFHVSHFSLSEGWTRAVVTVANSSAEQVGQAAAASSVVLTELRATEGTGLEDLYLQLTADDSRPHEPGGPTR